MLTFTVPLELKTGPNRRLHWAARAKLVKAERLKVARFSDLPWVWREPAAESDRFLVTLTRVAPRRVDDDNLRGLFKSVRDQVAAQLGIDDGSAQLEWRYRQEKGAPRTHTVRIEVQALPLNPFTETEAKP